MKNRRLVTAQLRNLIDTGIGYEDQNTVSSLSCSMLSKNEFIQRDLGARPNIKQTHSIELVAKKTSEQLT